MLIKIESIRCPDVPVYCPDAFGIAVRILRNMQSIPKIYKARKFTCKSLKGRGSYSGIRIIYAYFKDDDRIELVERYFKGDKENEDRQRILKYYSDEKQEK